MSSQLAPITLNPASAPVAIRAPTAAEDAPKRTWVLVGIAALVITAINVALALVL